MSRMHVWVRGRKRHEAELCGAVTTTHFHVDRDRTPVSWARRRALYATADAGARHRGGVPRVPCSGTRSRRGSVARASSSDHTAPTLLGMTCASGERRRAQGSRGHLRADRLRAGVDTNLPRPAHALRGRRQAETAPRRQGAEGRHKMKIRRTLSGVPDLTCSRHRVETAWDLSLFLLYHPNSRPGDHFGDCSLSPNAQADSPSIFLTVLDTAFRPRAMIRQETDRRTGPTGGAPVAKLQSRPPSHVPLIVVGLAASIHPCRPGPHRFFLRRQHEALSAGERFIWRGRSRICHPDSRRTRVRCLFVRRSTLFHLP